MEHPIQLVEDITEFMFPCPECESETFHVVGMRPYGLGVKIPSSRDMTPGVMRLGIVV
jgi:hypothetical protein